jgi:formate hydrogenlyase subunit 3/multisubunit Na+/H+ antiporter MnhD subunit
MKILVAFAFLAILASLVMALVYMMRTGANAPEDGPRPKNHMAKALAFRVGFSILLFICVLIAWKLGWIQPSGIPAGA